MALRYTAVPTLPRTAMPTAPPSSAPVSESAEAEPARSGGAALITVSVVRVKTGASPSEKKADETTITSRRRAPVDEGEDAEADRGEHEAARDDGGLGEPPGERGREHRADDVAGRPGQRPETRDEGREAQHELEVLRDEDVRAERDEDAEDVRHERGAERRPPKEPQVDERVREVALPLQEDDADGRARRDRRRGPPAEAVLRAPLHAVDHEKHAREREGGAPQIEPPRVRVAELRQEPRADEQEQGHHRNVEQEDGAPREVLAGRGRRGAARWRRRRSSS